MVAGAYPPAGGGLDHAQAASLVGLAPVPRDSGKTPW
jgi:hypothetical protein